MQSRLALSFALILGLWNLSHCADVDDTTRDALILAYAQKSQASISCVYTLTDDSTRCIDTVSPTASFGSVCQIVPLFAGATATVYSSSTCSDQGYATCTSSTQGSATYNSCTQ